MDRSTRNETIGALLAACAAEVRSRPAKALRAHSAVAGEIDAPLTSLGRDKVLVRLVAEPRCTDRDLPIAPERNRYTGNLRPTPSLWGDR